MKPLKAILIISLLFLLPSYSNSSDLGALRTNLIHGDVRLMPDTSYEWLSASLNMPLREGDKLWVPESGRLEIQINDGSFLRLDEGAFLRIIRISSSIMHFELRDGRAYVNFKGTRDKTIQIDMPYSSTIRTHEPSKFSIDMRNYRYAEVSVFKGIVYADIRGEMTGVYAGQSLTIREDMYADISPIGVSDEWELWNRERDRRFEGSWYSYRYLPDELRVYAYEFDTSGRWVHTVRYGYVWVPTAYVTTKWVPYRSGQWVWIGNQYVWVSHEPWGWVPYHYGRWAFSVSIGWFWVPPSRGAVYWGPGFVGWIHTPTYVAWVPLAPEDIYYGYGYYGPRSVNITYINVHKTVIEKVYINVYVDNAVTVVKRDSFVKGRYIALKTDKNPFIIEGIHPKRTKIVSETTSLLPVTRHTTVKSEPAKPAKMTIRDADRMRNERTVSRETITTRQTIEPRSIYPERAKRETVNVQRREISSPPERRIIEQEKARRDTIGIQRREVNNIPERRIVEQEQRVRVPEISREQVRKELPQNNHLTNRQPHSERRVYTPERRNTGSSERPAIERNKKTPLRETVQSENRQRDMDISQWIRR